MMKFTRYAVALAAILFAAVAFGAPSEPRDIVKQQSDRVLKALVERRAEFNGTPAKLEAFVRQELEGSFDQEYSARLVLGRHGRGVESAQIAAFAEALTQNLLKRYGKAMLDFDPNVDVKVLSQTPLRDGKLMRVSTEIERTAGSPVPVDYMFRKVGADWKVFDVLVEGVSYVQTYRTQFDEQLRNKTLDQVIKGLQEGTVRVDG